MVAGMKGRRCYYEVAHIWRRSEIEKWHNSLVVRKLRHFVRRERDSNPRYLSVRRFSRPVHSTTLPSLLLNMDDYSLVFISVCKGTAIF